MNNFRVKLKTSDLTLLYFQVSTVNSTQLFRVFTFQNENGKTTSNRKFVKIEEEEQTIDFKCHFLHQTICRKKKRKMTETGFMTTDQNKIKLLYTVCRYVSHM